MRGGVNQDTLRLQHNLVACGYKVMCHGQFTAETSTALRKLQIDHGLPASGRPDSKTLTKIGSLLRKSKAIEQPGSVQPIELWVFMVVTQANRDTLNAQVSRIKDEIRLLNLHCPISIVCPRGFKLQSGHEDVDVIYYSGLWSGGLKLALKQVLVSCPTCTVFPFMAGDTPCFSSVRKVLEAMTEKQGRWAVCDWQNQSGVLMSIKTDSLLWEQCPLGSVLFKAEMANLEGTMPQVLAADVATWMAWFMDGHTPVVVNVSVGCISRREYIDPDWTRLRASFYSRWNVPKLSALMITGKSKDRYPLARVSLECFQNQTWANKELVIINHGSERVNTANDPRVHEVQLAKTPGMTLGDLRNEAIHCASGEWCMTWDDDDWHHPTRMANQMSSRKPDHLSTFLWQVRCSLLTMSAFYDHMPTGQQMSVLYQKGIPVRYESLEVREDTRFMEWFGRRVININNSVDNVHCDPTQYIRFYHGRNIWDQTHIMAGSSGQYKPLPGHFDLIPAHASLLRSVIDRFKREDGFSTCDNHPGAPA